MNCLLIRKFGDESMSAMIKEKLWTKDFLLDTGINFLVFLIYYLLMVIIAVIAKNDLNASLAEAGLASGQAFSRATN